MGTDQTMVNIGDVNPNWKRWMGIWLLLVVVLYIATPYGFWALLTGSAGLYMVYGGVRSVVRAFSSRSVEEATIGLLGGQRKTVQVIGTADPVDEPLTAPLSGTECVAYQIQVVEQRPTSTE